MIGRLNHLAIVVPNLETAIATWRDQLGATVSRRTELPEHGVTVAFVELPNTKLELMEPLGDASPIRAFLERNPAGGMHHVCLEVVDVGKAAGAIAASGARVAGGGEPRTGAHGVPVVFLHPTSFHGTLIELENAA